jgi:CubicO group peptidase (beta-lactamase class C family)
MPMTRRSLVKLAAAAPFLAARPVPAARPAADDSLRSNLRRSAGLLGLPGFVAGVVRDGKLSLVLTEGFSDLESRTPMRQDHIFFLASLTKTFIAVMMMQYVQLARLTISRSI